MVARSRDASDRCYTVSREQNVIETSKLVGRLPMPRAIMRTSFKVKRSRSRPINAETEIVSYLWNGKARIQTTRVKGHLKEFLKTDTISKKLVKN